MNIQFPSGSGIAGFVYWLVKGIMGWGWISYGFAIVFFTLFIKLMLAPLDFLNRFLTRRTQIKQQALSAEVADLNQTYANDPLAFTRARQELYRKNGVGGLGSSLVSLASMILSLVIFFNVMSALNTISKYNIYQQYVQLDAVYQQYKDGDQATLETALNQTYQDTNVGFGWIKNIWQPDNFWSSPKMSSAKSFNQAQGYVKLEGNAATDYENMYQHIKTKSGGNGWLLLALLAGLTSYLSMKLTTIMNQRTAPKKPEAKKAEPIISYSMRDARQQQGGEQPMVDAAQVGKMMQWIMPIVLMMFAIMQTSAFAIYMIASSVVSTLLTLGFSFLIELIIKHMKAPVLPPKDFDATVINPHAKYFKGGRK